MPKPEPFGPLGEPPSPVQWLHQPASATSLDIVCLGWSAPPAAVQHYNPEHAVVTISNPVHQDWVEDIINAANSYDNCRITAWSLGVVTASRLLGNITHAEWVAINGVHAPFDGCIDRTASEQMASELTPAALSTFQMGMCGSRQALRTWQNLDGHPTLTHAQMALAWWITLADQPAQVPLARWRHIVIGSHDRIMPPDRQVAQWTAHPGATPTAVTAPHWIPTYLVADWTGEWVNAPFGGMNPGPIWSDEPGQAG